MKKVWVISKAQTSYQDSVKHLMKIRTRMSIDHRANYVEDKLRVFDSLVPLLIKQGENKNAFHYAELSKSRSFFELMLDQDFLSNNDKLFEKEWSLFSHPDYVSSLLITTD